MSKKPKILAAMLFMYVSLICVGFASWTISGGGSNPSSATANGLIETDDVINTDDYIDFNGEIEGFSFYQSGFLNENNEIVDNGSIISHYNIDINSCKITFASKITVIVTLQYAVGVSYTAEQNIFKNNNTSITAIASGNNIINQSIEKTDSTISIYIEYDLTQISASSLLLDIDFNFIISSISDGTAPANGYFYKTVYPFLAKYKGKCFSVSTKLVGE